jgi:hypothetical protein
LFDVLADLDDYCKYHVDLLIRDNERL